MRQVICLHLRVWDVSPSLSAQYLEGAQCSCHSQYNITCYESLLLLRRWRLGRSSSSTLFLSLYYYLHSEQQRRLLLLLCTDSYNKRVYMCQRRVARWCLFKGVACTVRCMQRERWCTIQMMCIHTEIRRVHRILIIFYFRIIIWLFDFSASDNPYWIRILKLIDYF